MSLRSKWTAYSYFRWNNSKISLVRKLVAFSSYFACRLRQTSEGKKEIIKAKKTYDTFVEMNNKEHSIFLSRNMKPLKVQTL